MFAGEQRVDGGGTEASTNVRITLNDGWRRCPRHVPDDDRCQRKHDSARHPFTKCQICQQKPSKTGT